MLLQTSSLLPTWIVDFTHQRVPHISKTNFVTFLVFEICCISSLTDFAQTTSQQESCAIAKMSAWCTILQYAHGLKLESPFVPSSTDCWPVRAKIRQNGRLGGRRGETGSRNMAASVVCFIILHMLGAVRDDFSSQRQRCCRTLWLHAHTSREVKNN